MPHRRCSGYGGKAQPAFIEGYHHHLRSPVCTGSLRDIPYLANTIPLLFSLPYSSNQGR